MPGNDEDKASALYLAPVSTDGRFSWSRRPFSRSALLRSLPSRRTLRPHSAAIAADLEGEDGPAAVGVGADQLLVLAQASRFGQAGHQFGSQPERFELTLMTDPNSQPECLLAD